MTASEDQMRIGVDLGGTKIEAIALSHNGQERARKRITSPRDSYETTIATLASLVDEVEHLAGAKHGSASVGVGMPGSPSPATGLVRNANSTWLNDRPFARDLEVALNRPLRVANDANCFAVSEAKDGAGAGAPVVFGVILGTGVGGGVVVNGKLLNGVNGIAGEWGHNPLPHTSRPDEPRACWCGRRDCTETYLSGPALARDLGEEGVTARDIATRSDKAAIAALDRYIARLGRALATVVNVLDPDVIVLGGGISNIERLYRDAPDAMRAHVFSDVVTTRIVQNCHGDSSGVRGAAWLWQG
ncbi:MAG: ROK family protein [Pikeienuella sp.]